MKTTTPRLLSGEFRNSDHHRYDLRDFELMATLMPGVTLEAGYNLDMAGRFNPYDATGSRAYDGLFFSASAVNSPYVSLTDGGNFVGTTMQIADDLQFHFGASSLTPQHAGIRSAGVSRRWRSSRASSPISISAARRPPRPASPGTSPIGAASV